MFSFQFNSFFGILGMVFMVLATLFFVFILPSMIATALWNSVIFELLNGIEIDLLQGGMLWAMFVLAFVLIAKPKIQLAIENGDEGNDSAFHEREENSETNSTKRSEHWKKWRKAAEKEKRAK